MTTSVASPLPVHIANLTFRHAASKADGPGFRLQLDAVDLPAGQSLVCIGASGCGKSTFLQLLAGILIPEQGTIRLGDVELAGRSDAARRDWRISNIGLVFQEFELLEHLTVAENVLLPYFVNRNLRRDAAAEQQLHDLAARLGIEAHLPRKPEKLSQGERQRVALCRALVTRPRLLLADEPTGSLDGEAADELSDLLAELNRDEGVALVCVTHSERLAQRMGRVLALRSGTFH